MSVNTNPYNFNAELDLGGYDCDSCGWNNNALRATSDFYGFTLTDQTGCIDWTTVKVTNRQDAENTLRDWAAWWMETGDTTQGALDAFVSQVLTALDAFNAAEARRA